jgi:hypothetical protein
MLRQLVEKFFMESVKLQVPHRGSGESAQTQIDILHSYIYTCCFWGCREVLKRILDLAEESNLNVDLNAQNKTTLWTPLHAASFQEHGPVVMLLLEKGASPAAEDSDGWTAVHYASVSDKIWPHFAARGLQRIPMQTLLDAGVIVSIPDSLVRSSTSARSLPMASYDRPSSVSSQSSVAAALNGDVLATDDSSSTPVARMSSYNGRNRSNNIY